MVRAIANSGEGLAASLSPTLLCPHIYHNSINEPGLRSIKSLCGRLTLVINPVRNSDKFLGVYTISVPVLFYLNVSLLGFHMDPGEVEYPVCGWNDIVFKGLHEIEATFCGKPYEQSTFTEGSTIDIMTYHNYKMKSKPSSLIVSVEYQVSVRYPYDEGRSLRILLHSSVLGTASQRRVTSDFVFIIDECAHPKSKDYYSTRIKNKETRALPFIDFRVVETTLDSILSLHKLQGISKTFSPGWLYTHGSIVQTSCHSFRHSVSDLFKKEPIKRSLFERYDSILFAKLRRLPLSEGQFQYKKFTVAHLSSPNHRIWSVYLWSFSISTFKFGGKLRPNTLTVYMPKQNCSDRQSDRIIVFDGPYAGILTPSGLMTHFPMIASKTCSDVTKGNFYNGSVGDLTLVWRNEFGLNASITFLYFVVLSECVGQHCSVSTFPVKFGKIESVTFLNPDRPKFTILKLSGRTSNIKLRLLIEKYSLRNYDNTCQLSGIFIFEQIIKMILCSAMTVARFNLTMHSSGIQFGAEVTICVKSYPQSNIAFIVEYQGTTCYGLVNECFNVGESSISRNCKVRVRRALTVKRPGKEYNSFEVQLFQSKQQYCCAEIIEMPSDYIELFDLFSHYRKGCTVHIYHPDASNFNTTLSFFLTKEQCCGSRIFFEDYPQPLTNVQDPITGASQGIPLCSSPETVLVSAFHVA